MFNLIVVLITVQFRPLFVMSVVCLCVGMIINLLSVHGASCLLECCFCWWLSAAMHVVVSVIEAPVCVCVCVCVFAASSHAVFRKCNPRSNTRLKHWTEYCARSAAIGSKCPRRLPFAAVNPSSQRKSIWNGAVRGFCHGKTSFHIDKPSWDEESPKVV